MLKKINFSDKQKKNLCPFKKYFLSNLEKNNEFYMKIAYNNAIDAWNLSEVPVGAVIVYKNNIIASTHNKVEMFKSSIAHAEILAIQEASTKINDWRLNESNIYVTKEPCPMCSGALIMSRVSRVFYGAYDLNIGSLGGACDLHLLKNLNHKLKVESGILQKECASLIKSFFETKRK